MLATAVPPLATAGDPPPAAGGAAACTTCGGGAGAAAGDDALLLAALAVLPWLPTELAAPLAAPGLTLALGAPPASLIPDADADPTGTDGIAVWTALAAAGLGAGLLPDDGALVDGPLLGPPGVGPPGGGELSPPSPSFLEPVLSDLGGGGV